MHSSLPAYHGKVTFNRWSKTIKIELIINLYTLLQLASNHQLMKQFRCYLETERLDVIRYTAQPHCSNLLNF